MTDPTNYWTEATPRRNGWMDRAARRADAWHAARQSEPEPEPVAPDDDVVAGLSLSEWAQVRASLGVRTASEFVGLNRQADNGSGFPDAGATLSTEQLRALGQGYRSHDNAGYQPGQRGIDATLVESIGGVRSRGNANPNTITE